MTERNKLIEDNINLVYTMVNRYFQKYAYDDDFIQEGMLGLIKASDKFNPEKGVKFSTYACNCIRNKFIDYINRQNKRPPTKSLDTYMRYPNGEAYKLEDVLVGDEDIDTFWLDLEDFANSNVNEGIEEIVWRGMVGEKNMMELANETDMDYRTLCKTRRELRESWRSNNADC